MMTTSKSKSDHTTATVMNIWTRTGHITAIDRENSQDTEHTSKYVAGRLFSSFKWLQPIIDFVYLKFSNPRTIARATGIPIPAIVKSTIIAFFNPTPYSRA